VVAVSRTKGKKEERAPFEPYRLSGSPGEKKGGENPNVYI